MNDGITDRKSNPMPVPNAILEFPNIYFEATFVIPSHAREQLEKSKAE